mmetsp:Transcript_47389/g.132055  ORF Transcript_47389/g.132055 Transcript_47389/m.132055 type:complete len:214 (+) Transcript_47389:277-918(+)
MLPIPRRRRSCCTRFLSSTRARRRIVAGTALCASSRPPRATTSTSRRRTGWNPPPTRPLPCPRKRTHTSCRTPKCRCAPTAARPRHCAGPRACKTRTRPNPAEAGPARHPAGAGRRRSGAPRPPAGDGSACRGRCRTNRPVIWRRQPAPRAYTAARRAVRCRSGGTPVRARHAGTSRRRSPDSALARKRVGRTRTRTSHRGRPRRERASPPLA